MTTVTAEYNDTAAIEVPAVLIDPDLRRPASAAADLGTVVLHRCTTPGCSICAEMDPRQKSAEAACALILAGLDPATSDTYFDALALAVADALHP